jgi:type II restriction enzyme
MDLSIDPGVADGYSSKAQRSRVITETWASTNLYCLNCEVERIEAHQRGKRVEDFLCPSCDRRIQLTPSRDGHATRVSNSAYEPKMEAIRDNSAPDYAFMGFDPDCWRVTDLFVVPGHFITPNLVEKRDPLNSDAQRCGWVGSNILLNHIPEAGRIDLVDAGIAVSKDEARNQFDETAFLSDLGSEMRDWTTALMDCIDELPVRPGGRFEISDVF